MARGSILVLGIGLLALVSPARAQEAYTLRLKKAGPGSVVRVEKVDRQQVQDFVSWGISAICIPDKGEQRTYTLVYRETILARPVGAERVTHLRREYERAQSQSGGRTSALPWQGKTYDIEKINGRYQFRFADGEALPVEEAKVLDEEFNSDPGKVLDWEALLFPSRPVRVNESWDLDLKRIASVLANVTGMQTDPSHGTARARLAQVFEHGGRRYAVVEAAVGLPVRSMRRGTGLQELEKRSRIDVRVRFTGAIDGGPEAVGLAVNVRVDVDAAPQENFGELHRHSECDLHQTRRELPGR